MSTIIKRGKEDDHNFTKHRYVIKGVLYRVQVVVYDYEDTESPQFLAWVLHQDYHKFSSYRQCGDLIYHGISIKECWNEVESYTGEQLPIPKEVKELQPFLAQQT